jgi:hypothetical protein
MYYVNTVLLYDRGSNIISNKITTCKEDKSYEYEYVLPDDPLVATYRPEHATCSVFRTSDCIPKSNRFPPPDRTKN